MNLKSLSNSLYSVVPSEQYRLLVRLPEYDPNLMVHQLISEYYGDHAVAAAADLVTDLYYQALTQNHDIRDDPAKLNKALDETKDRVASLLFEDVDETEQVDPDLYVLLKKIIDEHNDSYVAQMEHISSVAVDTVAPALIELFTKQEESEIYLVFLHVSPSSDTYSIINFSPVNFNSNGRGRGHPRWL